jgi:hypothetical protein
MFATLLGALPSDPDLVAAATGERVRATISDLTEAGLELLTDGEPVDWTTPPSPEGAVAAWRLARAAAEAMAPAMAPTPVSARASGTSAPALVKHVLAGP